MAITPKLLDLFCGAGGCSMGYHRAGFEVIGVDINPQKRYPFEFVQGDALEYADQYGHLFDVIHASPPCQAYSAAKVFNTRVHPDLVSPTRDILNNVNKPYIIENVPGAPLFNPIKLCGTMFSGLRVIRHRLFESNPIIWWPPAQCKHIGKASTCSGAKKATLENYQYLTVVGHSFKADDARIAMDINWMTRDEIAQAIPPAYTEWLGKQILELI